MNRISILVCWMLTPNVPRTDGHRIQYLQEPNKWRKFDPTLFDFLQDQVIGKGVRKIDSVETSSILPNCKFYSEILEDNVNSRKVYFDKLLERSRGSDLVFFDPDNGMEVKSVAFGKKNSSKYLFWPEVQKSFGDGFSVLVYQHLPPKPREKLINGLAQKFAEITAVRRLYLYQTQFVTFFLVPQADQEKSIERMSKRLGEAWQGQIEVRSIDCL